MIGAENSLFPAFCFENGTGVIRVWNAAGVNPLQRGTSLQGRTARVT